jgi:hypothetical protein
MSFRFLVLFHLQVLLSGFGHPFVGDRQNGLCYLAMSDSDVANAP